MGPNDPRAVRREPALADCPGAGKQWIPGTGAPICPVCHRGVVTITGARRTMRQMRGKAIPPHSRYVSASYAAALPREVADVPRREPELTLVARIGRYGYPCRACGADAGAPCAHDAGCIDRDRRPA